MPYKRTSSGGGPRRRPRPGQRERQRAAEESIEQLRDRPARPDPKPSGRVRNDELLHRLRPPYEHCPLCGSPFSRYPGRTRHHVVPKGAHGGDDVTSNIVWLCGDGTRGCHGLIEAMDLSTRVRLRQYLERARPDTLRYVIKRMGPGRGLSPVEGLAWLDRRYPLTYVPPGSQACA